ncbi:ABC1 family-domain-containing protein [Suillus cothurnatus]|nr:ABC1 family-domain-containing protein [Suillus cothurnatus]
MYNLFSSNGGLYIKIGVFQREFNKSPQELFAYFDEQAIASASVTQVHKARTWDGDWVAVKVQEPDVGCQTSYDLMAFRACICHPHHLDTELTHYISSHLRAELDFISEASSAQWTATLVASELCLAGKVHIPKINGVRLSDREALGRVFDEKLPETGGGMFADTVHDEKKDGIPESMHHVKLRGGMHAIMHTMVELFSAQMFDFRGYVSIFS